MERTPKTSLHLQENDSSSVILQKNNPIIDLYKRTDDRTDSPVIEIMSRSIPQNSSPVRIKYLYLVSNSYLFVFR
jgi:hypothetical protein